MGFLGLARQGSGGVCHILTDTRRAVLEMPAQGGAGKGEKITYPKGGKFSNITN